MSIYIIPALIVFIFFYAFCRRVNTYKSFANGARDALRLVLDILPYICAILVAINLLEKSGLLGLLVTFLAPLFSLLGIPQELTAFIILKPFSGSGSIALFETIISTYGANSYIARVASVIAGSTETIFYISAVYFSKTDIKKLGYAIPLALFVTLLSAVLAGVICRIL